MGNRGAKPQGHWLQAGRGSWRICGLFGQGIELLVGIGAEEIAEVAMDGRRVPLSHVVWGFEKSHRETEGLFGKGEDLEPVTVEGKEVFVDESISGQDVVVDPKAQDRADPVVAVKGDAVSIGCEDQEEVQEKLVVCETLKEPVPEEPVFECGKASRNLSSSFGHEEGSVNHGSARTG